ncbi:hypothetical protein NWFMUON74_25690 [Nocardia wallacei]|uniref:Uncharacterized protein n=1 Tax=Nocardia wallacei TaxID=480035 RepID=A0A7G1KHT8_9NOCA|nr:hypothetical protein NWFMUON74_25690 [Nocardia wallacei]
MRSVSSPRELSREDPDALPQDHPTGASRQLLVATGASDPRDTFTGIARFEWRRPSVVAVTLHARNHRLDITVRQWVPAGAAARCRRSAAAAMVTHFVEGARLRQR